MARVRESLPSKPAGRKSPGCLRVGGRAEEGNEASGWAARPFWGVVVFLARWKN